ncbi:MAG: Hsp20/alpha crystallin family protein [Deltaproteobacteria bacterium]|nr:Hsp20/alpha crystallin family protein [Deltaproteobacteria bacterium]
MTDTNKALQAKEKEAVTSPAEQTVPGPTFTPYVDIFETEKALTVVADMPGVKPEDLNIDLRENVLSLVGDVAAPEGEGETDVYREYRTGRYLREFALGELIDQDKIDAELKDGVLRLTLPKVEKATPRKIAVKSA